jgi:hypothetical protein
MNLQMIRYNKTGEVLVIDPERKLCTPALTPKEQTAPLADYNLDYEFSGDEADYSVIKATA